MSDHIKRLLSVASASLADTSILGVQTGMLSGPLGRELVNLLGHRNGFYGFESALLVRPFDCETPPFGIVQWNSSDLWKSHYKLDLSGLVCFAEDIFGTQFCIGDNVVSLFDPETGEVKTVAASLENWARWILEDHRTRTGWPLAHFWQLRHTALKQGARLLPKVPFVLGGQFTVENLYELDDVKGMRFQASVANQLRECPDGSKVILRVDRPE